AIHDDEDLPRLAVDFDLGLATVMSEPLGGRLGLDVAFVAVERDRSLGLPGDRLGLLELFLTAEGLDRLVEDGLRVLVVGPRRDRGAGHEADGECRTNESLHGITSMLRGTPGARSLDANDPPRASDSGCRHRAAA